MAATTPRATARRPWRQLPWAGVAVVVAFTAYAAYDLIHSYRKAVAETGRVLETQARVIAEQTTRSLQSVDLVLRHLAAPQHAGRTPAEWHAYLQDQAVGLVQVEALALFDASGRLVANSVAADPPPLQIDFGADPALGDLRLGGGALSIGTARPALFKPQVWVFPIVRRIEAANGRFAGTVFAGGRVEYFQQFYADLRLDAGTAVTLLHRDGTLLARHPAAPGALGQRVAALDALLPTGAPPPQGPVRGVSPVDGVDRFGVVALTAEYPLVVVVTRDAEVALAAWRENAAGTLTHSAVLGLLSVGLLWMVRRQFVRLDQTRQSLETSRERFALAAAGSDEGIWDWDVASDRIYASARAREIFGLPEGPETQPRETWFQAVRMHPQDVAARRAALQAHLDGATPAYAGEYRVRGAGGDYRWIRVRGLCVRDAAGAPVRMAGSVTDIDAQRRAEDALRLSEQRYALAMTGSTGGHWVWELPTDALFVSGTVNQLFGLPTDSQPRTRTEFFSRITPHPDDRERLLKVDEEVRAGRVTRLDFEYRILLPDGGQRWILTRAQCFRGDDGEVNRVAGISVDVTERKRTEEALRLSEERFALAVAGSNDGIVDWDIVNDRMYTSPRTMEMLGVTSKLTERTRAEWVTLLRLHPDDRQRHADELAEFFASDRVLREGEYRIERGDGEYAWVRLRNLCVRDADGRPLRLAGSVSDIDAYKRVEAALLKSQERYALAVAGSDDGMWDWDFGTGIAFESRRARELQGLPLAPEEQPIEELEGALRVHPDDAPRRIEGIRAHFAGETPAYECEYRVCHADGVERWIRVRALCIRGPDGRPCRVAGSVSDIDARKRAEQALRASEERFALAVAGSDDGILDWDIVNDTMYVSERAMRIVGVDPCTTVRTREDWAALVMPRFHPDDVQRLNVELLGNAQDPADKHEGEYRVRDAQGQYRWTRFRGMSVRDAQGRAIRWAGSLSDIDAEKRTEEALRRSEERYELAVAGSNEGLWDWDLLADSVFLSARAQELLGLPVGEPLRPRRDWLPLAEIHLDERAAVRAALAAHLRGNSRHFKVEYRLRREDGSWHWYRQRGVAVRDASGRPTRMAGSIEDISDRKRSEDERSVLEQQLRQAQKLEAIGTLAGGIAHDFNNILAAILGYGEMAAKDAPEGSTQRRHIDAAMSAGMRAKSLVERILAFSRSGMGDRVPVHVQSVVEEALGGVEASLPAGITLRRRLDAGNAAVLGDPTQVHQVVMNLCANAAQAMKAGGTLTVSLERMALAEPRCTTSVLLPRGDYLALRVRDTGSGIEPQLLERIFDPFFTTKEVGVGTGLGLSLVHGIVTDLGGGICVDSRPGQGSTFTVFLPSDGDCEASAAALPAEVPAGRGETILLVDDEEPLVRLGEEMIAELGYEPVGFTSSTLALATFRAEPQRFHAVLSDEAMPEMTGSELVREIRRIRPDIPVVLMSGYVTAALSTRARDAGVAEVLSKPLVSRDIARSLAGALQR